MKRLAYYFLLIAILAGLYVYSTMHQPQPVDWTSSYSRTDKIPMGTYVFFQEIPRLFQDARLEPSGQPAYISADTLAVSSCYFIVGPAMTITETDLSQLISYTSAGNQVFIASKTWDESLVKRFHLNVKYAASDPLKPITICLTDKRLAGRFAEAENLLNTYFNKYDTSKAEILGHNSFNGVNFIRFHIGKGYIYLHTNPAIFTNYFLLKENNALYTAQALSLLPAGIKTVFWDEYYHSVNQGPASPLNYILSQPALKFAWFTALITLLLFLLFESKRKHRLIPVPEPVRNTTVEFIETIARLYFNQRNNNNLASKLILQFKEAVSNRFNMSLTDFSGTEVLLLSEKSQVDKEFLFQLLLQMTAITSQTSPLSDPELLSLNQNIEKFYTLAQ